MISVARAFTSQTTTSATQYLLNPGYWDEDNRWIKGGMSAALPIQVTPLPAGDKSDSTYGESLQARPELERKPTYMKFLSKTVMPIGSLIIFNGGSFKVIRNGDYTRAGFNSVVGIKLLNLSVEPHGMSISYSEDGENVINESFSK